MAKMSKGESSTESGRIWVKKFDQDAIETFYSEFMKLHDDESLGVIPVFISSYGGEVFGQMAMRDIIKSSDKPVATIALGQALSSGLMLLAAGTKGYRFASPNTVLLYHEMSSWAAGKINDIKIDTEFTLALQANSDILWSQDTGMSTTELKKRLKDLKNADWWIKPQLAKQLGIIDHIGVPRLFEAPAAKALVCAREPKKKRR